MAARPEEIEADYVVVGAGSAGCVLAARLSEDGAKVVLLEAGPPDWHPFIHIPAAFLELVANPAVNWNFATTPEAGIGGRAMHYPRGKVLGGSGSINGMLYVRGNPADYDGWAQIGCRGWSYAEVLPIFKRSESYGGGEDAYRGRTGPIRVEEYRTRLPATDAFVAAAQAAGIPFAPDMNGAVQEGVGHSQMTRTHRRQSTAVTYLAPARSRPNLKVETGALAERLLFEGRRCTGVAFRQNGRTRRAMARVELVLASGAIGSPQLLQISGIGPGPLLGSLGVAVVHELAGVGENLVDHIQSPMIYRLRAGTASINQLARMPRLAGQIVRWLAFGDGALTFGVTASSAFVRSRPDLASPDLQIMFSPGSFDMGRFGALEREPGATIAVCIARPDSRGWVRARSPDPAAPPDIHPNYLADPRDFEAMVAGMRLARRIAATPPLAGIIDREVLPGAGAVADDELKAHADRASNSVYHPVGTCRMGTGPAAVVDERLRVRGLAGLRVADASIMPTITTGNTNAPTVMIAEKAADMIRQDRRGAAG
jgi:choline dehydrogenase